MIQRNVNIFTQETLYPSFILRNNWSSPSQMFYGTSTFYYFFTIFKRVIFVTFQVNPDFLINQLTKYFYTRQLTPFLYFKEKFVLSIPESFRNIQFLPHFYYFSQWMMCAIFHINSNRLIIQHNINIFTQDTSYPFFISKKKLAVPVANVFRSIQFLPLFHYF